MKLNITCAYARLRLSAMCFCIWLLLGWYSALTKGRERGGERRRDTHLVEVKRINRLCRVDVRQQGDIDVVQEGIELVGDVRQLCVSRVKAGRGLIPVRCPMLIHTPWHDLAGRHPQDPPLRFSLRQLPMKESWRWLRLNPGRSHASPAAMSTPHYREGASTVTRSLRPPISASRSVSRPETTRLKERNGIRTMPRDSLDALRMIARLSPSVFEAERDTRERSRKFHYHITHMISRIVRDTWHHFAIIFFVGILRFSQFLRRTFRSSEFELAEFVGYPARNECVFPGDRFAVMSDI